MTKSQFYSLKMLCSDCLKKGIIEGFIPNDYLHEMQITFRDGISKVEAEHQAKETIEYLRKQIDNHKIEHSQTKTNY